MELDSKFAAVRKGLLEFVVLELIAKEPMYAADLISQLASTEFATQEGTLYPLLSRLRRDELVDYEWRESASGPPRKYYRLTDKGHAQRDALAGYWQHLHTTLETLRSRPCAESSP
jgi:PadR family transcriptional regulator PadR